MCYLGIDVGTTNIKAATFTAEGELLALARHSTPVVAAQGAAAPYELDLQALYACVCRCIQEVVQRTPLPVCAVAVSSMGEAGAMVDKGGVPLTNAIAWFDPKTQQQAEELARLHGKWRLYQITGQIISSKFGLTKLLWARQNQPEAFARMERWMPVNDYVVYRLTGRHVTDYSIAARTMAFDISGREWSGEILESLNLPQAVFGQPVPGGSLVGEVTPDAVAETGLPRGTRVVSGGHDHACAAVGAGTLGQGRLLSSMGTSEVCMFTMEQPVFTEEAFQNQYSVSVHCSPRLYRGMTSMQACGASVEWFLHSLGSGLYQEAMAQGEDPYQALDRLAEACPEDPCLLYCPLLRGSLSCPDAGGAFWGIRDYHTPAHFAKALLDGVCSESAYQVRGCMQAFGVRLEAITAVGGPAFSPYWMKRKAAIAGMPVAVPAQREAACLGAAMLAAVGVGERTFDELPSAAAGGGYYSNTADEILRENHRRYTAARPQIEALYKTVM